MDSAIYALAAGCCGGTMIFILFLFARALFSRSSAQERKCSRNHRWLTCDRCGAGGCVSTPCPERNFDAKKQVCMSCGKPMFDGRGTYVS